MSGGRRPFCRGGCDIFVARPHWVSLTDIFVGDIRHAAGQRGDAPLHCGTVPDIGHGHIAQLLQVLHPALHGAVTRVVQLAEIAVAGVAVPALVGQGGDFCKENLLGRTEPPVIPYRGGKNSVKSGFFHSLAFLKMADLNTGVRRALFGASLQGHFLIFQHLKGEVALILDHGEVVTRPAAVLRCGRAHSGPLSGS